MIIARTCKGHGVSFMEDRMEWHYLPMTEAQYRQAVRGGRTRMRNVFCQSLIGHAEPAFVFLTGDLGFQALEPLQAAAGPPLHQRRRGRAEHGLGAAGLA